MPFIERSGGLETKDALLQVGLTGSRGLLRGLDGCDTVVDVCGAVLTTATWQSTVVTR